MSIARSSAAVAAALTCVLVAGCAPDPPMPPAPGSSPGAVSPTSGAAQPGQASSGPDGPDRPASGKPVAADISRELQRVLSRRAGALTSADRERFLDGLVPDPEFRVVQEGYFDNLAQLPLTAFDYRLLPASLVRNDDGYWGVVEVTMQLGAFDDLPVRTLDRFRFAPTRRGGFRIASTTDVAWERANLGVAQPWDVEPIRVRAGSGVLGVFDGAATGARRILRSVERGLGDIGARVPYDWSRQVLFYALGDPRFLASFDDVPGGDPAALDAVAFSLSAGPDDDTVASTRFALTPSALAGSGSPGDVEARVALDRLVRHELTHVAVGTHDDDAPVWLSEGVAEWASVQALSPEDRTVPQPALAAARGGSLRMPDDASFNDADAEIHYALAWWVCEWIAQTYGEQNLWAFLDAFTTLADQDDGAVVRQTLQMSLDELARRGAALMVATYEPPVLDPVVPSTPPGSPATQAP